MIYLKKQQEIQKMRIAGKLLAELFQELAKKVIPGISVLELDKFAETFIISKGMHPSCKGYGKPPYPFATCISLNDVVVHGVPRQDLFLKDGDLLKVDVVASYQGYCADMARTFVVGACVDETAIKLAQVAEGAFEAGKAVIKPGKFVHDISAAIQKYVESHGFYVVREFVGHGIGRSMHEEPMVPNFVSDQPVVRIMPGMTLAIEPMILASRSEVVIDDDGWTARAKNGVLSAHYEDTIVVTNDGCMVLTSENVLEGLDDN